MVTIRLMRRGGKKEPFYHVVVTDSRRSVGGALEQVGFNLVAAGLTWCVSNPEQSKKEGYSIEDVQKMFVKLA